METPTGRLRIVVLDFDQRVFLFDRCPPSVSVTMAEAIREALAPHQVLITDLDIDLSVVDVRPV